MLLFENIKLALSAIKANKMRAFLTMLGIIIGISSVITITAIGASAQSVINKEFESYGAAYMFMMIDWRSAETIQAVDLFTFDDVEALKARFPDEVKYATLYDSAMSETTVARKDARLTLMGVDYDYHLFNKNIAMKFGRMINAADVDGSRESVVISVEAARFLFNKENAVGSTIPANIRGKDMDLSIVGVYETPPSIFTTFDMSDSYSCYIPITALISRSGSAPYIEIYGNEKKDIARQGEAFVSYMTRVKGQEEGFYRMETLEGQMSTINTVLGTLSVALGAIAAISLLVGGIGIMNIMLVSVTERTREIGIRKSLGARTKDILTQFLIEAMILSCIGGIIGTITGVSLAGLGMSLFGIQVVLQPVMVVITVIFSAGVGLFFGIFPARKAARLDPIEALRYE